MIRSVRQLRPVVTLFLSGNRVVMIAGLLLSSATALSGIALLGLSGWFITATAIAGLTAATALTFDVFAPSAGIRFLAMARTASRYGERLVTHDATLAVLARLREELFRGWARPDAARHLVRRPSRLLFRLTLDIDALDSLYLRVAVPAFAATSVTAVAGAGLGLIDATLGLTVAVFLVLAGLGLPVMAGFAARVPVRRRAYGIEALRSRIIALVSGQTDWIMTATIADRRNGVGAADRYLASADDALHRIETWVAAGLSIASAVLLSGALVVVTMLANAAEEDARIGAPLAALVLLVTLAAFEPFAALRRGALELGRTLIAARRIAPRLVAQTRPAPAAKEPSPGMAVHLDGVVVRHPAASFPAIRGIDLAFMAGECIALIGPSGAGKSTLLGLLAGDIQPEAGDVAHQAATLFTQRTELFQDSVRDNLRLAEPAAADDHLLDVLEAAGLRHDIEALPYGLDTPLGEGGYGLSGGQARRLALARLFLRDTPLWLLDEPTEGLDGPTARDVLARLRLRAAGRTVVIATHIRREAEIADRLVMLNHGTVTAAVARGEPGFDALLAALRPD